MIFSNVDFPAPDSPVTKTFASVAATRSARRTASRIASDCATISITIRENLIRQLAFPKIVLPTASVVTGLVDFGFGLIALGAVYLFFLDRLSAWVLLIPLIAVVQFLFTLSLAIVASAAAR